MKARRRPLGLAKSQPTGCCAFVLLICTALWILSIEIAWVEAARYAVDDDTNINQTIITHRYNNNFTHELECRMRSLAMEYARTLQSWRHFEDPVFRHVHDALQLTTLCGQVPPPPLSKGNKNDKDDHEEQELLMSCSRQESLCIFVSAKNNNGDNIQKDADDGSKEKPVNNLHRALHLSRTIRRQRRRHHQPIRFTKLILRHGIHELGVRPLVLTSADDDDHIKIMAYPNEEAWISGGLALPPERLTWKRWSRNPNVWVTNLTQVLPKNDNEIPSVASLFTSAGLNNVEKDDECHSYHQRWIRARYPNGNPETDQWGYNTPGADTVAIPAYVATEWHKPAKGRSPTFDYVRFDTNDTNDNHHHHHHLPYKNDSTMDGYNLYASGHGGVCAEQWGTDADSYWCSNASQGGWAFVDREAAVTGQLQIPVGVSWNATLTKQGRHLGQMLGQEAQGGIVFAWHSQTWAMHMFRIANSSSSSGSSSGGINQFHFEKGGGKQGGRNWCRCDQCTYAGPWCGQNQNPSNDSDTRLIGGRWMVENLLPELDQPGEFYFNHSSRLLYVYPNTSCTKEGDDDSWKQHLRFAMLENLIELRNVHNVEIIGVGFRDSAATFMSDWSAPSGGDWALHRGGAVFLQNTSDIVVQNSIFRRLDSNAIFLSGRNRNTLIQRNTFEWLAENAIATWGDTDKYDATSGDQPWNTKIYDNIMSELGIYQKQSSGLGQAKAALSDVRRNIMFNMPRAAINFNDMVGGGDMVIQNLLFNTCRESGDHGPVNSWDRQPYLTKLRDGKTPSFDPLPRIIMHNYIIGNYGADQGVDNDDGSSWFRIKKNVFYDAAGFKMDYGGHDSVYEENLNFAFGGRKNCVGVGTFKQGHGDVIQNNRCIVGLDAKMSREDPTPVALDSLGNLGRCNESNMVLQNNTYHSPQGKAGYHCYDDEDTPVIGLADLKAKFGLEAWSTCEKIPPLDTLVRWVREMLFDEHHLAAAS